jgi:hypothetical protein
MKNKTRTRRIAAWVAWPFGAATISLLMLVAWDQATFNLGEVQPGRIYRSGQMPATALAQTLRAKRVKTVLNLRGANPGDAWYRAEVAATCAAGATQIDVAMSSCIWMSRAQLKRLIKALDDAEYPMLIHCSWGSERTALVSAFAELLRPGGTLDDARGQFSIRYLFVRANDGKVMAQHLDQYEAWLRAGEMKHDPSNFHRWVDHGFTPGVPSREQWPFDPYPLVVITRPGSKPVREPLGAGPGPARLRK